MIEIAYHKIEFIENRIFSYHWVSSQLLPQVQINQQGSVSGSFHRQSGIDGKLIRFQFYNNGNSHIDQTFIVAFVYIDLSWDLNELLAQGHQCVKKINCWQLWLSLRYHFDTNKCMCGIIQTKRKILHVKHMMSLFPFHEINLNR